MKIIAIIPARGGSKSIPRKNIRILAGKPMIAYAIDIGKKSKYIQRVIVSTDSEEIAEIAKQHGAEAPFLRPSELAQDLSPDHLLFRHAVDWLKKNENYEPDIILSLKPNAPLRRVEDVDKAIEMLIRTNADCVKSIQPVSQHPYKMWTLDGDNLIAFQKTDLWVKEGADVERQKLPQIYASNADVDVFRTRNLYKYEYLFGEGLDMKYVLTGKEAIDIDTPIELKLAEKLLERRQAIEGELAIIGGKPIRDTPFPVWPEINENNFEDIKKILKSGELSGFLAQKSKNLGGEKVKELEKIFSEYFGVKHAVAVNSATAGLHCAVVACGIGQGDEVITSPYTFSATASSIIHANATPIFADVDEKTFCINPEEILKKINPKTKAIMPVHILGHAADMDKIIEIARKCNLKVIEDAAQSLGAKYKGKYTGTIGDIGVFSFNQKKDLVTGEGGVILTNDDQLAERARLVRNHGENITDIGKNEDIIGYNYRMNEIEAAIAIEQFKKFKDFIQKKSNLIEILTKGLSQIRGLTLPYTSPDVVHSFHSYCMLYDDKITGVSRKIFAEAIKAEGIKISDSFYTKPVYMLPYFQNKNNPNYSLGSCLIAEKLCNTSLWIRIIQPNCNVEDVQDIVEVFKKVERNLDKLRELDQKII